MRISKSVRATYDERERSAEDALGRIESGGGITAATTVQSEELLNGAPPNVGVSTKYAREDHTHGTPPTPTAAEVGADPDGAATAAVATHVGLADPHSQYALDTDLTTHAALTTGVHGAGAGGLAPLDAGSKVPVANLPGMVASGASHAAGIVPDPGAVAGTTKYLCENGTWAVPPGTGGVTLASTVTDETALNGTAKAVGVSTNVAREDHTHGTPKAPIIFAAGNGSAANAITGTNIYCSGSSIAIGGRIKAGTTLRWRLSISKDAVGTATPIFYVRMGTNGNNTDAAVLTWTGVAQTAATDVGWVDIEVRFYAIGASGYVTGMIQFSHFNTTTGLANKAQVQIFETTSTTFDTTPAGLIAGLAITCGTATWTLRTLTGEALNLN